jgi:hypothetical protein
MRRPVLSPCVSGILLVACILTAFFPGIPPVIPLPGIRFPDLLWPVLVFAGIEKVTIDPASPRNSSQTLIPFSRPRNADPGNSRGVIGLFFGFTAGYGIVGASASHRVLDAIVHKKICLFPDSADITAGAGLRRWGPASFVIELVL